MSQMNFNNKEMEKLMKTASKKSGIDFNKIKNAAESGNVDDFIDKNLSSDASKKIKSVLSDKASAEKLLSTPQAKELLRKLLNDK